MYQAMMLIFLVLLFSSARAEEAAEIDRKVNLIVRLCIAGGHTETVTGSATGDANISIKSLDASGNLKGDFKITRQSAEGLVNGIDNAISALAASEADKARECLKPLRDRLMDFFFPMPIKRGYRPNSHNNNIALRRFRTKWQASSADDVGNNSTDIRLWNRNKDHWEESTIDGKTVMYHDIVESISLNGCDGERTEKEEDKKLEMFIPYKGCRNMLLMFRFNNNAWMKFGPMAQAQ